MLASNVGGIPEIIKDEENGFLVKPREPKMLAEKINKILSLSAEKKETIKQKAKENIASRFSLEKMVKEYELLYKELLN